MPFQVFRRHQRKMLAALAILAMFAFVLADSLPRLFQDYARPTSVDRVVVKVAGGRDIRSSDLERLRVQRIRANYVLSQLALRIGGTPVAPYFFEGPPFGGTDDEAMVDALLLERKADAMRIPRSADLARNWIFEQARMRHELYRNLQPTLPAFNPDQLAADLQEIFNQTFGREMTVAAFLTEVADQVRIQQALELLSQSMETPLDAFELYSDRFVEVEARYVEFPVEDQLDRAGTPDADQLRAFFDSNAKILPDPTSGRIGFRVPRRAKIEYLALGINAIDVLRERIRGESLAEEIRAAEGFEADVLERYQAELQQRESALFAQALPVNPFTDPSDGEGIALSYPEAFERRYVAEQVEQLVQERLRDRIEELFDPVKQAMNEFTYEIPGDLDAIRTGLEPEVDRDALPDLWEAFRSSDAGRALIDDLGTAAGTDEGVSFVRIGLTEALADPEVFQQLLAPEGIPEAWRDYLALARLDWERASYALLRSVQRLTRATEGIDRPDAALAAEFGSLADVVFDEDGTLFDPREFTDPEGRRYLVWKTMDLPEMTRTFEQMPEGLVESLWRRDRARALAAEAAEALAKRVREAVAEGETPAEALDRIAAESGLIVRSTGPRRRVEPLSAYAPIDAGEDFRDALFRLGESGEDAAAVAPGRTREAYYVMALLRRADSSLGGATLASSGINYENALSNLSFFLQSETDREADRKRTNAVIAHLRQEYGIAPDWTPENPGRG